MLYFRVFWVGSTTCSGEVGIAFRQKWIENVSEVGGISDRIVVLKLAFEGNCYVLSLVTLRSLG